MKNVPVFLQDGYSLAELIVVVTILGAVAAIAVPGFSASSDKRLQLAAEETAAAMRYARSEALRSGAPHGFHQQSGQNRIRVFRLDGATTPATLVYDVYHPIDKTLYNFDLDGQPSAAAESMSRNAVFRGTCNQARKVFFDSHGTPWCTDPESVLLQKFELHMYLGSSHRLIVLDGVTGRVTVQ